MATDMMQYIRLLAKSLLEFPSNLRIDAYVKHWQLYFVRAL